MNVSQNETPPKMTVIKTTNLQYMIIRSTRSIKALKKDKKQNLTAKTTNHEMKVYACNIRTVSAVSLAKSETGKGSDTAALKFSASYK